MVDTYQARRMMDDRYRGTGSELNPHATAFVPRVNEVKNNSAPSQGQLAAARHANPSRPGRHMKPGNSERRGSNSMRSNQRGQGGNKAGKVNSGEGRSKPSIETETKENGPSKEESSQVKEVSPRRFNILFPDPSPPNLLGESSCLKMKEKQVIWFEDDSDSPGKCSMLSDDPTFNRDLKRGERFATIPPTANEKEEIAFLRRQLEEATKVWDDNDYFLENAIERHRLAQVTHVKPLPSGLNQLELGTYRGLFTLPWVMQVRRDFPDDAMKAKLALARATCLKGLTEENLDPEKGDVPICLVNWGLLQDPNAAKRRQKEKQEEERWQEGTREVWMHQVVAEGIYEHQSQTLYPHEFGSPRSGIADALDKWDYGSYMYHQQTNKTEEKITIADAVAISGKLTGSPRSELPVKVEAAVQVNHGMPKSKLRPIVKTSHLNSSFSDECMTPSSGESDPDSSLGSNKDDPQGQCSRTIEMMNSVPICAVRPSYRFKSTARNLHPIEAI